MITHKNIHIVKNNLPPFTQARFVRPNKHFACSIGIFVFLCSLYTNYKLSIYTYLSMHAEVQEAVNSFEPIQPQVPCVPQCNPATVLKCLLLQRLLQYRFSEQITASGSVVFWGIYFFLILIKVSRRDEHPNC